MITKEQALSSLRPNTEWVWYGNDYSGLQWLTPEQTKPSEAEINTEIVRLQAQYDNKEYQRLRAAEYPSLAEFADAYYWAQKGDNTLMDAYVAKCDAVKTKYPKD